MLWFGCTCVLYLKGVIQYIFYVFRISDRAFSTKCFINMHGAIFFHTGIYLKKNLMQKWEFELVFSANNYVNAWYHMIFSPEG